MNLKILLLLICFSIFGCSNTTPHSSGTNNSGFERCKQYASMNTQAICSAYWNSTDRVCDSTMISILGNRRVDFTGYSCKSQHSSFSAASNSCVLSKIAISNMASSDICHQYHKNRNRPCDNDFRAELSKRNQNIQPESVCGTSNTRATGTAYTKPTPSFVKPLTPSEQCSNFIDRILRNENPVSSACSMRYKSLEDETIQCRAELNHFITTNSEGVGNNIASCGKKLSHPSLDPTRAFKSFYSFGNQNIIDTRPYFEQITEKNRQICKSYADSNDADGLFCLYKLEGVKSNYEDAFKHLINAVKRGHPIAQTDYAWLIIRSKDPKPRDKDDIQSSMLSAAIGGYHSAQLYIGWSYMNPKTSAPKDYSKAMFWNLKAAEKGRGEAASNIGMLYEKGWGVPLDVAKAVEWHTKAIQMGFAESGQAEVHLAQIYEKGAKDVPKNTSEAIRLYRRVVNELNNPNKESKALAEARLRILTR